MEESAIKNPSWSETGAVRSRELLWKGRKMKNEDGSDHLQSSKFE